MKKNVVVTPIAEKFIIEHDNIQVYPLIMEIKLGEEQYLKNKVTYILEKTNENDYVERFEFGVFKNVINNFFSEEVEWVKNKIRTEVSKELKSDMLIPLCEWFCDSCEEAITKDEKAILQFYYQTVVSTGDLLMTRFKIVHNQDECSVVDTLEEIEGVGSFVEIPISDIEDRIPRLLALKEEDDIKNESEFAEILKRIEIPYYEEARMYIEQIEDKKYELDSPICKYDRKFLRNILLKNVQLVK